MTALASAALAGVAIDHAFPMRLAVWLSLMAASTLAWWTIRRRLTADQTARKYRGWDVVCLCITVACVLAIRHHSVIARYHDASVLDVLTETAEPTIAIGVVDEAVRVRRDPIDEVAPWIDAADLSGQPDASSRYQSLITLQLQTLRRGIQDISFSGRVLVRVNGDLSELRPGDRVRVLGHIATLPAPSNPGQSDPRIWAMRNEIHATLKADRVRDIERLEGQSRSSNSYRWVQRRVTDIATSARQTILQTVSPEQQGIALALILGQRDLLENDTSEALIVTGTAHLLSVSGLHLGILFLVARLIAGLLRMPLGGQLIFLAVVTLFYVAITGGRPPVLRAAILLATLMLSIAIARPYHPLNSLSLALIFLLWAMPLEIFSIGMQLSFLAVATLLSCGRPNRRSPTAANDAVDLEENFDRLADQSRPRWVRVAGYFVYAVKTAIWYSGCVTVVTLPLVWHEFHVVSPVSVLVNVILSPMMMVALSVGVATVVVSWIFAPLAIIPGWLCSLILSWMTSVIEWASEVPGGHFWLPSPSMFSVVTYFVGLVAILAFRARQSRRKPITIWSVLWIMLAWKLATIPAPLPPATFESTFIDVGHGTATILRPDRETVWLYDCGWLGNFRNRSDMIDEVLWSMGVTRIDGIVLSHADADHFNALPGLVKRFAIERIVTPPGMLSGEGRSLGQARRAIEASGVEVTELDATSEIPLNQLGDWWRQVEILHPPAQRIEGSDNANSMVLQINHADRPLLLPGDLEPPGTSVLISQPRPRPGGVMMAPHHGSLRMDADAVLQWARPSETVVSGGKRAAKVEVTEMLSATGGGVHVTSNVGCVRVRIDGGGTVQIRSWKVSPW
ncbi:ComEC family competence protein [Neorhodopirellula pilleata]|uniref:ComEC family competence protein n=2 Tax=Neorhodopirellula pilleata TaxID=2714738 RepID=A0A5C6AU14_9BACT|nr:ComEC family competence protein [Neorhodopirellula pilleata]